MSINSSYVVGENGALVETEGGVMTMPLSVLKSPLDLLSEEAKTTYVTKQRSAAENVVAFGAGFATARIYDNYRAGNGFSLKRIAA